VGRKVKNFRGVCCGCLEVEAWQLSWWSSMNLWKLVERLLFSLSLGWRKFKSWKQVE
jgi:hypothetical protein